MYPKSGLKSGVVLNLSGLTVEPVLYSTYTLNGKQNKNRVILAWQKILTTALSQTQTKIKTT